jgi:hypothetical protein
LRPGTSGHSSGFRPAYKQHIQPCSYEWHFLPLYPSLYISIRGLYYKTSRTCKY